MLYPNGGHVASLSHSQSSRQHFAVGELACRFPVFPEAEDSWEPRGHPLLLYIPNAGYIVDM